MLLRLCGPPSISLSFSLAAVLPGGALNALARHGEGQCSPHQVRTFTAGTTRVSNPVCSPSFRASVSDPFQRAAFATGVLLDLNAFHRYTKNSALPSWPLALQFRMTFHCWAVGFHIRHTEPPTHSLRPVNPNNARHLCITAAAGTELAVASSSGTIKSRPC